VVSAPTSTAASAVRPAAPSAAPATTGTPSAASAAPAFTHRSSLVYYQRAAQKILAIAGLNRSFCLFVVSKLRESESARLTRELVPNDLY